MSFLNLSQTKENLQALNALITPDGQQMMLGIIQRAKHERGAQWLEWIKKEYPGAVKIIDLVANKTADEAINEIQKEFPILPLPEFAKREIRTLHEKLAKEIDKPQC